MITATTVSALGFALILPLCLIFQGSATRSLAITVGMCLYHFGMRLAVGYSIKAMRLRYAPSRPPLRVGAREEAFYRRIGMDKLIKRGIPTYSPEEFDMSLGLDSMIYSTCRAETVHAVIVLLSFLPLLLELAFPSPAYIVTSLLSAAVDTFFVVVQRSNRPRLIRLYERQMRRADRGSAS